MIKVIASDMDGTLLCDDHRIAPDTIAAVKEACAAGIRFMVATGRGYEGAMAELDGTGIVCDYILGSGAEVRDPQRKIVKECGIGMDFRYRSYFLQMKAITVSERKKKSKKVL